MPGFRLEFLDSSVFCLTFGCAGVAAEADEATQPHFDGEQCRHRIVSGGCC